MMATGGARTKEEPLKLVELWEEARRAKLNIRTVLRLQFPWLGASSAERFSFACVSLAGEPQMRKNASTAVTSVEREPHSRPETNYGNEAISFFDIPFTSAKY